MTQNTDISEGYAIVAEFGTVTLDRVCSTYEETLAALPDLLTEAPSGIVGWALISDLIDNRTVAHFTGTSAAIHAQAGKSNDTSARP